MTTIIQTHLQQPLVATRSTLSKAAILTALSLLVACFLLSASDQVHAAERDCTLWFEEQIALHNRNSLNEPWVPLNPLQLRLPNERPWVYLWKLFQQQAERLEAPQQELLDHLWFSITSLYQGERWPALLRNSDSASGDNLNTLEFCLRRVQSLHRYVADLPAAPTSDYQGYKRWIILNAITEPMVLWQLRKELTAYQERWRKPARQAVRHYLPPEPVGNVPTPQDISRNLLGFPVPSQAALEQLSALYAPAISVADPRNINAIGAVQWQQDYLAHQPGEPTVYTWPSFAHYRGHQLLQLNYQFWFQKPRDKTAAGSLSPELSYSLWRVTLKPDGHVLFYESVRGDGLFYALYPASRGIALKTGQPSALAYPHTVPNARQQRVELLIEPDSHLVIRVTPFQAQQQTRHYQLLPHQQLLSLATATKHHSIYSAEAAVLGSKASPAQAFLLGINNFGQQRAPHRLPIGIERMLYWDDPQLPEKILQ